MVELGRMLVAEAVDSEDEAEEEAVMAEQEVLAVIDELLTDYLVLHDHLDQVLFEVLAGQAGLLQLLLVVVAVAVVLAD